MAAQIKRYPKTAKFSVKDCREYTLDWTGWASQGISSASDKRREIVKKLNRNQVGVATEPINKQLVNMFNLSSSIELDIRLILSGICFVRAYYDGTSRTGEIKMGEQVVFDTVTGKYVTGIHESWSEDEYYPLGTALANYNSTTIDPDNNIIPVKLSSIGKVAEHRIYIVKGTVPARYIDSSTGDEVLGSDYCRIIPLKYDSGDDSLRYDLPSDPNDYKLEIVYNNSKKMFSGTGLAHRDSEFNKLILISEDFG